MIDFSITDIIVSSHPYTNAFAPSSKGSDKDQIHTENSDKNKETRQVKEATKEQGPDELSLDEVRELSKLKQRDREVKAHEQAHISAAGQYARGGAHYEYEKGPDGKNYAVGGEVRIDTSKIPGDPEATARKMQAIRSAAMAPASPSSQDRRVASKATQVENRMNTEILLKRYEESASFESGKSEPDPAFFNHNPEERHVPIPGSIVNVIG